MKRFRSRSERTTFPNRSCPPVPTAAARLSGLATPGGADIFAKLAKQLPGQLCFFVGGAWAYYRALNGYLPRLLPSLAGIFAYALTNGLAHVLVAPLAVTAIVSWCALAAPRLPRVARLIHQPRRNLRLRSHRS